MIFKQLFPTWHYRVYEAGTLQHLTNSSYRSSRGNIHGITTNFYILTIPTCRRCQVLPHKRLSWVCNVVMMMTFQRLKCSSVPERNVKRRTENYMGRNSELEKNNELRNRIVVDNSFSGIYFRFVAEYVCGGRLMIELRNLTTITNRAVALA